MLTDIDATLQAIEAKTELQLKKLKAGTPIASSFAETPGKSSFAQVEARLKQLQAQTQTHLKGANEQIEAMKDHYTGVVDYANKVMETLPDFSSSFVEEGEPIPREWSGEPRYSADKLHHSLDIMKQSLTQIDSDTQDKLQKIYEKSQKTQAAEFAAVDASSLLEEGYKELPDLEIEKMKISKPIDFRAEYMKSMDGKLFGQPGYEGESSAKLMDMLKAEGDEEKSELDGMHRQYKKLDKEFAQRRKADEEDRPLASSLLQEGEHMETLDELKKKMEDISDVANAKINSIKNSFHEVPIPMPPMFPASFLETEDLPVPGMHPIMAPGDEFAIPQEDPDREEQSREAPDFDEMRDQLDAFKAKMKAGFSTIEPSAVPPFAMASVQAHRDRDPYAFRGLTPESFLETEDPASSKQLDLGASFAAIGQNIHKLWAQTNKSLDKVRDDMIDSGQMQPDESIDQFLNDPSHHSKMHDMFAQMKQKLGKLRSHSNVQLKKIEKDLAKSRAEKTAMEHQVGISSSFIETRVENSVEDMQQQLASIKSQAKEEFAAAASSLMQVKARRSIANAEKATLGAWNAINKVASIHQGHPTYLKVEHR